MVTNRDKLIVLSIILWSSVGIAYALPHIHNYNINATVADIQALHLSPQAEIDYVRRYVYNHSNHVTGWQRLATRTPLALSMMRLGIKPPLTCGYRALAQNEILARLGYQTRTVLIWSDDFDTLQGHVFSEVYYNGRWQVQDSDYNYSLPLSAYQTITQYPHLMPSPLPQFVDAFAYDTTGRGDVSRVYVVNFDLTKPLDNGLTLPQLTQKYYGLNPNN